MDKQQILKTAQDLCINLNGLYGLQDIEDDNPQPEEEYAGGGLFNGGYIGGRMGYGRLGARMRMMGRRMSGGYFRQGVNGRWYEKKSRKYGYGDLPPTDRRLAYPFIRNSNNPPAKYKSYRGANTPWMQAVQTAFSARVGQFRGLPRQQRMQLFRQTIGEASQIYRQAGYQPKPRKMYHRARKVYDWNAQAFVPFNNPGTYKRYPYSGINRPNQGYVPPGMGNVPQVFSFSSSRKRPLLGEYEEL
jgi:hypothetical protein